MRWQPCWVLLIFVCQHFVGDVNHEGKRDRPFHRDGEQPKPGEAVPCDAVGTADPGWTLRILDTEPNLVM